MKTTTLVLALALLGSGTATAQDAREAARQSASPITVEAEDAVAISDPFPGVDVGESDGAIQLTFQPGEDSGPSWSPDGSQIAFISDRAGEGHLDVWRMPATPGGEAERVTFDSHQYGGVAWSPVGNELLYVSTRSGNHDIWRVDLNGGPDQQMTTHSSADWHPNWSPDGTQVTFASWRSGHTDVWTKPVEGGPATQITFRSEVDRYPAWSPDGSTIAHSCHGLGISLVPATGGSCSFLAPGGYRPSWSPDGAWLAYSHAGDIWIVSVTEGTRIQVTTDPAVDRLPSWSPDGTQITFDSWRSGNDDIWVIASPVLSTDSDGDAINDEVDLCLDTMIPETVPANHLGVNRWALVDNDGDFDTTPPPGGGNGPEFEFTIQDTAGCSCEQIIEAMDLGWSHTKFGCSTGAMLQWVAKVGGFDDSGEVCVEPPAGVLSGNSAEAEKPTILLPRRSEK